MDSDPPPPPPPSDTPPIGIRGANLLDFNTPCRISNVNFEGTRKTRPCLLAKIVADLFHSKTILDFLERSIQVRENLRRLDAFSNVDMQVKPMTEEDDGNYEVTIVFKERGRLAASAQTAVDDHSTHLSLSLEAPNLNGIGDSLQLNSKFNKKLYSGEFRYSVPLAPWRTLWAPNYSFSYSQYQLDSQPSGFDQENKSITHQVDFNSLPQVQHSISFENVWRYIKSSSINTPIDIREQCGHSLKSSIKHTVSFDNRIGGHFPYDGILAKLSNEFATNLVSGGARFTRHEATLQLNALVLPKYDILCQVNVLAGTLLKPQKINICDRFFAGGPLTLRGFKFQGLEPNVRGYPLGDASYLSAGVHIYSILPYTTPETPINNFIRPHLFLNTGTIGDIHTIGRPTSVEDMRRGALRFRDSLRYSCGLGLVMYFMKLRFEVNWCLPLVFTERDLHMRGVHWGFGLSYT